MEKSSIITDIVLTLLVVVPIAYLILHISGRDKKVQKTITNLATSNGLNLSNFEISGNLVLGIDDTHKKLIYSNRKRLEDDFKVVDLAELNECRIKTTHLTKTTLGWVGLELVGKNSKQEIVFYEEENEEGPHIESGACLQLARKWEKLITPLTKAA
ncbi:hypothetical protein [Ulvibacter litoralis]|uniref:Uncharacterized protein n=1 Tax=Ulvibacter litoralis TaxID=227084 RepID=A0A1G7D4E2_9FLAO|nr:hypothetical protein [Ulvibacter litoralis]GHC44896.1 hypothetical protein GCM10008083_04430 [Ulvibacter litoralis]SDE46397.1 hypothetical protein SAMN05421855_101763 [Ulvibacter litoralis]